MASSSSEHKIDPKVEKAESDLRTALKNRQSNWYSEEKFAEKISAIRQRNVVDFRKFIEEERKKKEPSPSLGDLVNYLVKVKGDSALQNILDDINKAEFKQAVEHENIKKAGDMISALRRRGVDFSDYLTEKFIKEQLEKNNGELIRRMLGGGIGEDFRSLGDVLAELKDQEKYSTLRRIFEETNAAELKVAVENRDFKAISRLRERGADFSKYHLHNEQFISAQLKINNGELIKRMLVGEQKAEKLSQFEPRKISRPDDLMYLAARKNNGRLIEILRKCAVPLEEKKESIVNLVEAVEMGSSGALVALKDEYQSKLKPFPNNQFHKTHFNFNRLDYTGMNYGFEPLKNDKEKVAMACAFAKIGVSFVDYLHTHQAEMKTGGIPLQFLLTLKQEDEKALDPKSRKAIDLYRHELADAFIKYAEKLPEQERKQILKDVIDGKNLLGHILNTPTSKVGFAMSRNRYQPSEGGPMRKVTGSILRITNHFGDFLQKEAGLSSRQAEVKRLSNSLSSRPDVVRPDSSSSSPDQTSDLRRRH